MTTASRQFTTSNTKVHQLWPSMVRVIAHYKFKAPWWVMQEVSQKDYYIEPEDMNSMSISTKGNYYSIGGTKVTLHLRLYYSETTSGGLKV